MFPLPDVLLDRLWAVLSHVSCRGIEDYIQGIEVFGKAVLLVYVWCRSCIYLDV
jgi:hypothetical protein